MYVILGLVIAAALTQDIELVRYADICDRLTKVWYKRLSNQPGDESLPTFRIYPEKPEEIYLIDHMDLDLLELARTV